MPFNHHKRIPLPIIVKGSDGKIHVFSSGRVTGGKEYVDGGLTFRLGKNGGNYRNKLVEVDESGNEIRVADFSVTKNVCAIFITMLIIMGLCFRLKNWYKHNGYKVPRRGLGAFEALIEFVYNGVIRSTLKEKADKFAPYLLTVFMFIFCAEHYGTYRGVSWRRQCHRQCRRDSCSCHIHILLYQFLRYKALLEGDFLAGRAFVA